MNDISFLRHKRKLQESRAGYVQEIETMANAVHEGFLDLVLNKGYSPQEALDKIKEVLNDG